MPRSHISRSEIDEIIDELIALKDSTDPLSDKPSGNDKSFKAFTALRRMDHLADLLTGWASAHVVGQAITSAEPMDNNHLLEQAGYDYQVLEHEPAINRNVLARILMLRDRSIGSSLVLHFREALNALDFGEVQPILEPTVSKRHGATLTLSRLRLRAITHEDFRRGAGMKAKDAREFVGKAFNASPDTLRDWRTEYLVKTFGEQVVIETSEYARRRGKQKLELLKRMGGESISNEFQLFELEFGNEQLQRDAKAHKQAIIENRKR